MHNDDINSIITDLCGIFESSADLFSSEYTENMVMSSTNMQILRAKEVLTRMMLTQENDKFIDN